MTALIQHPDLNPDYDAPQPQLPKNIEKKQITEAEIVAEARRRAMFKLSKLHPGMYAMLTRESMQEVCIERGIRTRKAPR